MWRERFAMAFGAVLEGVSWICFALGGLCFFAGDKALIEFAHMNWGLAELLGTGGGIGLMVIGAALRSLRDS